MIKVKVIAGWNEVAFEAELQQFLSDFTIGDTLNSIQYSTCLDQEDSSTHYSALVTYVSNQ